MAMLAAGSPQAWPQWAPSQHTHAAQVAGCETAVSWTTIRGSGCLAVPPPAPTPPGWPRLCLPGGMPFGPQGSGRLLTVLRVGRDLTQLASAVVARWPVAGLGFRQSCWQCCHRHELVPAGWPRLCLPGGRLAAPGVLKHSWLEPRQRLGPCRLSAALGRAGLGVWLHLSVVRWVKAFAGLGMVSTRVGRAAWAPGWNLAGSCRERGPELMCEGMAGTRYLATSKLRCCCCLGCRPTCRWAHPAHVGLHTELCVMVLLASLQPAVCALIA